MSPLTPPAANPGAVGLRCRRPGGPETGVYIFELYYTASKRYFRAPKARGGGISPSSMFN